MGDGLPPDAARGGRVCHGRARAGRRRRCRKLGGHFLGRTERFDHLKVGPHGDLALIGCVGEGVVVLEYNGCQGSRPEVLRSVSSQSLAVSVYWNVNMSSRFSFAERAAVVTAFGTMVPEQRHGTDPNRLTHEMSSLPFHQNPIPAAFGLAERVTGVRLTPQCRRRCSPCVAAPVLERHLSAQEGGPLARRLSSSPSKKVARAPG